MAVDDDGVQIERYLGAVSTGRKPRGGGFFEQRNFVGCNIGAVEFSFFDAGLMRLGRLFGVEKLSVALAVRPPVENVLVAALIDCHGCAPPSLHGANLLRSCPSPWFRGRWRNARPA